MPEPDDADDTTSSSQGPVFSSYGIASAVLGLIAVAAIAFGAMVWSDHYKAIAERDYQSRVIAAAAAWTGVLVNMRADTIDVSLQQLQEGTVGQLNADFESSMKPYSDVVKALKSTTTGQIESVSVESEHRALEPLPGQRPSSPATLPPELAQRTDTVLVVATSESENQGGKPTTVRWNLRLGVSDVDGTLKISRLETMR